MTNQKNEVTIQEARDLIEQVEIDILGLLRQKTEEIKERTGNAIQVTGTHINICQQDVTAIEDARPDIEYWVSDVRLDTDFNIRGGGKE